MTATPPTLAEMRHALVDQPSSDEGGTPTLTEMMHANALYREDPDAYLEHYGIKGMKWGVRRSAAALGRLAGRTKDAAIGTKDEDGNVVGGIRAKSRAGAQKLKDMKEGSTLILEDANGASKVMAKQKDGTFKEVYLSADAERVLRTTQKDSSEMSDKEINDAINRANKIEAYNKIFNPVNPNADLQARVDAMELQVKLRTAERTLNPPKKKLVTKFIDTVEGSFGAYNRMDKAMNGKLNPLMKQMMEDIRDSNSKTSTSSRVGDAFAARKSEQQRRQEAEDRFWSGGTSESSSRGSYQVNPSSVKVSAPTAAQQRRVDDFVYNITTMPDPNNPFYNPTTPISAPSYPALEERRD